MHKHIVYDKYVCYKRLIELFIQTKPNSIFGDIQAWGWMEWKEGDLNTARELYRKTLSIDQNSESAARCLQVT